MAIGTLSIVNLPINNVHNGGVTPPPDPGTHIVTEGGDNLVTESGDQLVTE